MQQSSRQYARLTGLLYLIIIVTALYCELGVRSALIVHGDAVATARNILSAESTFRRAGLLDVLTYGCDVAVTVLLFLLTRQAGVALASVGAAFRLVYSALAGMLCVLWFHAVDVLHDPALASLGDAQRATLAYSQLELRETGFAVALIFFGVHLALLGVAMIRAGDLPTWIGVLLVVAACGYVGNSVIALALPAVSTGPWLLVPGLVAEGSLTFWLLVGGSGTRRMQPTAAAG